MSERKVSDVEKRVFDLNKLVVPVPPTDMSGPEDVTFTVEYRDPSYKSNSEYAWGRESGDFSRYDEAYNYAKTTNTSGARVRRSDGAVMHTFRAKES